MGFFMDAKKYNFFQEKEETLILPKVEEILAEKELEVQIPKWNVILLDDNEHTYDYVIEMLMKIFRHSNSLAFQMACEVDVLGRVVVYTTNKEQAEMKCEQIINYGPDWRLDHSTGSMRAKLEPADEKTDIQ